MRSVLRSLPPDRSPLRGPGVALGLWLALLAACGTAGPSSLPPAPPPGHPVEEALRARYPAELGGVRYLFQEADLNDDGVAEIIVYLYGPLICGTGGCDLLVFTPTADGLTEVAKVSASRLPLFAAPTTTHGWTDLIVGIEGGGIAAGRALLQFDGSAYPADVTTAPRVPDDAPGDLLLADYTSFDDGRLLGY